MKWIDSIDISSISVAAEYAACVISCEIVREDAGCVVVPCIDSIIGIIPCEDARSSSVSGVIWLAHSILDYRIHKLLVIVIAIVVVHSKCHIQVTIVVIIPYSILIVDSIIV